jgi:hypothetical protein
MSTLKNYFTAEYWKSLLLEFGHALCTKKFWKEFIVLNFGI